MKTEVVIRFDYGSGDPHGCGALTGGYRRLLALTQFGCEPMFLSTART